jgi:magnesium chelatase family protein
MPPLRKARIGVRTAIANSAYKWSRKRTTINLAPADIKKEGPSFDLPIAFGMIAVAEGLNTSAFEKFSFVGELALDGSVRPVKGVLPVALEARRPRQASALRASPPG